MNHFILTGRVGSDATISTVGNSQVINFNVAHSEKYKNAAGVVVEKTQWFAVSYFTDRTAIAAYIKKGTQLTVIGSVDVRMYDDKNGAKAAQLTVKALRVELLSSGQANGAAPVAQQPAATTQSPEPVRSAEVDAIYQGHSEPVDDLPF